MSRSTRSRVAALALSCVAASAWAQGSAGDPPPLAAGGGTIAGQIAYPKGSAAAAGTNVVLYGLAPDGRPGLRNEVADAEGRFRFENLSTAAGTVYLVGAHYQGLMFFAPRVSFELGQREVTLSLAVSPPTADVSLVERGAVSLQLEWSGNSLAVIETHSLEVSGDRAVFVAEAERADARPILDLKIPEGARDAAPEAAKAGLAFEERNGHLVFWGPAYPGTQPLRIRYRFPAPPEGDLVLPMPPTRGSAVELVVPEDSGIAVAGEGVDPTGSRDIAGRRYLSFERGTSASGPVRVSLPERALDASRVELTRVDIWLELDDAQVAVTEELQLRVSGAAHVVAQGDEPVLRIALPRGTELVAIAKESELLGARPGKRTADGMTEVLVDGPIPPGDSSLALRYRIPTGPADSAAITFRLPRSTTVLNVLIADTGVEIASSRLHRRRPFRSGTRTYLHREAFMVEPDEAIEIRLQALSRDRTPQAVSTGVAAIGMAAAAGFLIAPLRNAPQRKVGAAADPRDESSDLAVQRRAVVQEIRDLDHDFETGKIAPEDYEPARASLRATAVELLRSQEAPAPEPETRSTVQAAGSFCTACGARAEASWSFCASCGSRLASREDDSAESPGTPNDAA